MAEYPKSKSTGGFYCLDGSPCMAINITLGRTVAVARRAIDIGMNMLEMGAQKPAAAAKNASSSYQVSIQRKRLRAAILM